LGDLQSGPAPIKYAPQLFFFDFNPVIGGPINENKLWYFGSVSANRSNTQQLDIYFKPYEPSTPADCQNKPLTPSNGPGNVNGYDPTQWCSAYTGAVMNWSETGRVTHQVTPKHKLRYSLDNTRLNNLYGNYVTSGAKASVSYVTGSHRIKTGFEDRWANAIQFNPYNSDVAIDFLLNKTPILVNVTNGPSKNIQEIHRDGGLFAQDQWKLDRFTINLGIRWDWFNAGIPQQTN